ncbi:MAG: DUF5668 domain-containing protein [candidate division WOR-3 bacterium]|nr:DUF5668 domain-containing protein [candidate division WOR-3 bacterium]
MIRKIIEALILISIGLWIWLSKLGVVSWRIVFKRDWPLVLVIIGVLIFVEVITKKRRQEK